MKYTDLIFFLHSFGRSFGGGKEREGVQETDMMEVFIYFHDIGHGEFILVDSILLACGIYIHAVVMSFLFS